jgi:hypothetical protein
MHEAIKLDVMKIFRWFVLFASAVQTSCDLTAISIFAEEKELNDAIVYFLTLYFHYFKVSNKSLPQNFSYLLTM